MRYLTTSTLVRVRILSLSLALAPLAGAAAAQVTDPARAGDTHEDDDFEWG
jgi:hypothetical protein